MELRLSGRGDYVIRGAIALGRAFEAGGFRKIREVSALMAIPGPYAPQILRLLAEAGLAEARAGRAGGYRLLRHPAEITLRELVEAADGPLRPGRCTMRGGPCEWDRMCPLHPAWEAASAAIRDSLDRTTLAMVLDVDQGLTDGSLAIADDSHRRDGGELTSSRTGRRRADHRR